MYNHMAMSVKLTCLHLVTIFVVMRSYQTFKLKHDEDVAYWRKLGQDDLEQSLKLSRNVNTGVARNVVLAIGDGMGVSTITAARIYDGQRRKESGEENYLTFERYPHTGLLKTYSVNMQVPDSAATTVAMVTGVKTKSAILGYGSNVKYNVCEPNSNEENAHRINSILDWSLAAGKSVGIVTTDRVTGATPAASYAHIANRNWMNDRVTPHPCRDIAKQLIEDNPNINVILGGGMRYFTPYDTRKGRLDGRDLTDEWKKDKTRRGLRHNFVSTKKELDLINPRNVDYLFGLFADKRIPFIHKRNATHPSLTQMVRKAIQILSKNKKGFFLIIEGANIDTAHHNNMAAVALREVIEFNQAVTAVNEMTDESDTLVAVTADHSHVFSISGYPARGNPILSFINNIKNALDGKPTTSLGYLDGPGWILRNRSIISEKELEKIEFQYTGGRPRNYESHSGEDVALYAQGPMSHLFHGVHEQSYVAHVLSYASCVGQTTRDCPSASPAVIIANPKIYMISCLMLMVKMISYIFVFVY